MCDFSAISNCKTLKELRQQKRNLLCYIRWAKKALDKHIKTSKPITEQIDGSGLVAFDFLELEKDLRSARLELYVVKRKIIMQKRKTIYGKEKN